MTRSSNLFVTALVAGAAIAASSALSAATFGEDGGLPGGSFHGRGFDSGNSHDGFEGHHGVMTGRRWSYRHSNGRFGAGWGDHGPDRL